mgnify:CR=1 FL=1
MDYVIDYDVGDRKRRGGINEDSVAVSVFEQGHRDGLQRGTDDDAAADVGPRSTETGAAMGDAGRASSASGTESSRQGDDGGSRADAEETADSANRSAAVVALADGAGGHDAGDVASYIATTVICEELADVAVRATRGDGDAFGVDVPDRLGPKVPDDGEIRAAVEDAIVTAHREIVRYTTEADTVAHTTVVAGLWLDGQFHYGWVGDSRAYLVNGAAGRIERLTKDHSVVEELHDSGAIDDVEAQVHPRGNEITRAIGGAAEADPDSATVSVDTRSVPVYAEDVLLVTSDGLIDAQTDAHDLYNRYVDAGRDERVGQQVWDAVVTDDELRELVLQGDDLATVASDLIAMANERGGYDNLSTILAKDSALDATPPGLDSRAIDPPHVSERETVIIPDDS